MATPLLGLPPELAHQIFELLPRRTLRDCNLVCKWAREHASDILWRDVMLTDRQRWHDTTVEHRDTGPDSTDLVGFDGALAEFNGCDSHDDTPTIKLLFLLAKYPDIAAKVHSVTHRCHLPPPALFAELPQWSFQDCTLSNSWSTLRLLRLAVANMKNVKVLRLVAPHHFVATTLLREFFSPRRKKEHPIQHLWLESLSLDGLLFPTFVNTPEDFGDNLERLDARLVPRYLDLRGLESLRFRRLWADKPEDSSNIRTRCGRRSELHDGRGSVYPTTTGPSPVSTWRFEGTTWSAEVPWQWISKDSASFSDPSSSWFNDRIWAQLPEVTAFLDAQGSESLKDLQMTDEVIVGVAMSLAPTQPNLKESKGGEHAGIQKCAATCSQASEGFTKQSLITSEKLRLVEPYLGYTLERILHQSMSTLTSLCLDWVMWSAARGINRQAIRLLSVLSKLRFPHLRAFQYRNATSASTMLPEGVYLLAPVSGMIPDEPDIIGFPEPQEAIEVDFLSFLLAHDQITCLAWPIERFFKEGARLTQPQEAQKQVINNLGQKLETLRIDAWLSGSGEPQTDNDQHPVNIAARSRRHRFIEEFAPYMTKLTSLKMEGGIPKDEQRQILRALRQCPLRKIVQIGVNQPLGNSWGEQGEDISSLEGEFGVRYLNLLEPEPKEELEEAKALKPIASNEQKPFEPVYGSPPSLPLLYIIASQFGSTITELKFCGYNGAPVLRTPPPITSALLWHLRYFPKLRNLAISIWLLTTFEADWHESEVLNLWMSERKQYTTPTRAPIGWEDSQVRDREFNPMRSIFERIKFEERHVPLSGLPQTQLLSHDGGELDTYAEARLGPEQRPPFASTLAANQSEAVEQASPMALVDEMDGMSLDSTNASASAEASDYGDDGDIIDRRAEGPPPTGRSTTHDGLQTHPEDRLSNFINTNFRPRALAYHVNDLVGEHLSSIAKARKGTIMGEDGVRVRATFCIGIEQSDIFELDVWIDQLGVCGYRGPIEEGSWQRWLNGLDKRAWFARNTG